MINYIFNLFILFIIFIPRSMDVGSCSSLPLAESLVSRTAPVHRDAHYILVE
jgi:hypothetical protein